MTHVYRQRHAVTQAPYTMEGLGGWEWGLSFHTAHVLRGPEAAFAPCLAPCSTGVFSKGHLPEGTGHPSKDG